MGDFSLQECFISPRKRADLRRESFTDEAKTPRIRASVEKKRKLRNGFAAGEKDFFIVVLFFVKRERHQRAEKKKIVKLNATKSNSSSTTFRESYSKMRF